MPVAGGGFDQCYNAQAGGERCQPGAQRQAATRTDAGQDRGSSRRAGQARMPAGGHPLFQRDECRGLRAGEDRTADRHGSSAASSAVGRALRNGAGSAERCNAGRGHGASAEDAGRPGALRAVQADPGAGVRDHSNRRWDSVNFPCAASIACAANGASSPWPGTSGGSSPSPRPDKAEAPAPSTRSTTSPSSPAPTSRARGPRRFDLAGGHHAEHGAEGAVRSGRRPTHPEGVRQGQPRLP